MWSQGALSRFEGRLNQARRVSTPGHFLRCRPFRSPEGCRAAHTTQRTVHVCLSDLTSGHQPKNGKATRSRPNAGINSTEQGTNTTQLEGTRTVQRQRWSSDPTEQGINSTDCRAPTHKTGFHVRYLPTTATQLSCNFNCQASACFNSAYFCVLIGCFAFVLAVVGSSPTVRSGHDVVVLSTRDIGISIGLSFSSQRTFHTRGIPGCCVLALRDVRLPTCWIMSTVSRTAFPLRWISCQKTASSIATCRSCLVCFP